MRKRRRAVLLVQRILHSRRRRRLRSELVRHNRVRLLRRHSHDDTHGSADGIAIVVSNHAAQRGTDGATVTGSNKHTFINAHVHSDRTSIGNADDAAICGTHTSPDRFAIRRAICRAIILADCFSFSCSNKATNDSPDSCAIDCANVTAQCCAHVCPVIISRSDSLMRRRRRYLRKQ